MLEVLQTHARGYMACIGVVLLAIADSVLYNILAEGAMTLPVTLSGGVLFAS